jgi:hypothetical protein
MKAYRVVILEAATFDLENRLTDSSKVVSITGHSPFTHQEDARYSYLLEAEWTPRLEELGKLKKTRASSYSNPLPSDL